MEKNFNDIVNSISEIETPKHLRQAVFICLEKEKNASLARKRFVLKAGSVISGICSVAAVAIIGKEILSSEFFSIVTLGFYDAKTIVSVWQDYAFSLLETLPTASIAITLLPIFTFMLLLREYGKLEYGNQQMKTVHLSFRT